MAGGDNFTWGQRIGIVIIFVSAGLGGMEQAGFGFGLQLGLPTYLVIAFVGGAIGGLLMGRGSPIAGLLGGMLAGPGGLLAVFYWANGRSSIHTGEAVIAQGIGSLPGIAVYFLLKAMFGALLGAPKPEDVAEPNDSVARPGDDGDDA